MVSSIARQETILIVDDTPANLDVLFDYLDMVGFTVLTAEDGMDALERAQRMLPDLILLDVMMPGIDGFETCRRLKSSDRTKDIPVIFVSALNDVENRVRGFEAGGVDYVTKPFQYREVLARITAHLTIGNLQKTLQARNQELDAFARTVAHDLQSPLNRIVGFAEILSEEYDAISADELQEY